MAGIDGIINKIEPPPPLDEDIYELVHHENAPKIKNTPGSLTETLEALEKDHQFLLRDSVFTKDLIQVWIDYKKEKEVDYVQLRPHPGEFALYFDA